jgi:hypothetical protein
LVDRLGTTLRPCSHRDVLPTDGRTITHV